MKNLLLASSALVATAAVASAQEMSVNLSGSAEMGVFSADGLASSGVITRNDAGEVIDFDFDDAEDGELQFHTDIDVTFSMAGETDAGLTFGASIDLDEGGDGSPAEAGDTQGGEDIFVSGSFGTLTMGDTDGAKDWAMQEAIIGGSLIDDGEHFGWNGNSQLDGVYDGQIARYEYSFGGFAAALSAEIDDSGEGDPALGIGVRYSGEFGGMDVGAGLGYQTVRGLEEFDFDDDDAMDESDPSAVGASVNLQMNNGIQAILNYSSYDDVFSTEVGDFDFGDVFDDGDPDTDDVTFGDLFGIAGTFELDQQYGIALGYEFGAFLVGANYGRYEFDTAEIDGYSLVANYDLGGGAELQAGYSRSNFDVDDVDLGDNDSIDTYSFGIAMSF